MFTSSSSIMRRAIRRISSIALTRPFSPRVTRNRHRQHADLAGPGRSMRRTFANSSFVRIGHFSFEAAAVGRLRLEQVALRAEARLRRGDDLLADAIDRRIRDLREELLEVVVEQLRLVREHRERRVVAHRADGLDAVSAPSARGSGARLRTCSRTRSGAAAASRDPAPAPPARPADRSRWTRCSSSHWRYGRSLAIALLDLLVVDDAALLRVDEEHAARLQAALLQHVLRRDVEHAGFRRHDRRDRPSSRSSATDAGHCDRAPRRSACRR